MAVMLPRAQTPGDPPSPSRNTRESLHSEPTVTMNLFSSTISRCTMAVVWKRGQESSIMDVPVTQTKALLQLYPQTLAPGTYRNHEPVLVHHLEVHHGCGS